MLYQYIGCLWGGLRSVFLRILGVPRGKRIRYEPASSLKKYPLKPRSTLHCCLMRSICFVFEGNFPVSPLSVWSGCPVRSANTRIGLWERDFYGTHSIVSPLTHKPYTSLVRPSLRIKWFYSTDSGTHGTGWKLPSPPNTTRKEFTWVLQPKRIQDELGPRDRTHARILIKMNTTMTL